MLQIVVVNNSKKVTDVQARAMTDACNLQVARHLAPAWSLAAVPVTFLPKGSVVPAAASPIAILDAPDQPGALGYHTEENGKIWGRVFVNPVLSHGGVVLYDAHNQQNVSVASVLSHEVLELACDPSCNRWVDGPAIAQGSEYALETCLTGDTLVSMLDGTERTIESLKDDEEFWVYGCTPEGDVVPARGHSARLTRKAAPIVEVELDNGEKIRCTPEHRFLLRDGTYTEAGSLTEGTSLMPLYRRRMGLEKGWLEYEQVSIPSTGKWTFTHRLVVPNCPVGYVRHHVDFNRFNNEPKNLQVIRANEHFALHGQYARVLLAAGTHPFQQPQGPERRAQSARNITVYNKSAAHRAAAPELGRRNMSALWERENFREHHSKRGGDLIRAYNSSGARAVAHKAFLNDPDRRESWAESCKKAQQKPEFRELHRQVGAKVQAARTAEEKSSLGKKAMHLRWHESRGIKREGCGFCGGEGAPFNHKVVAIRDAGFADVWDISVDGTHNFALKAGVFVHNCDPVESDSYAIQVVSGGATVNVSVSNFAFPEWFDPQTPHGRRVDQMSRCAAPFTMTAGGYMIVRKGPGTEQQINGAMRPAWRSASKAHDTARGVRRKGRV